MMKRTLYAYLDIDHPYVAWEVAIGRIKSDVETSPTKFGISQWMYARLAEAARTGDKRRLHKELLLEAVRQCSFPGKISRLKGVYFFTSTADAEAAINRWFGGGHRLDYISEVIFEGRYSEHDSEWFTWYFAGDDTEWMRNYWSGEVCGQAPLTEVLADGFGVVLNKTLREKAYARVIERSPYSSSLLGIACCGFHASSLKEVAIGRPAITKNGNSLHGDYYIWMGELEAHIPELMESIAECKRQGIVIPIIRHPDPNIYSSVPDLRPYSFRFDQLNEFDHLMLGAVLSEAGFRGLMGLLPQIEKSDNG